MEFAETVAQFIDEHRTNLKLIAFYSHGSDYEKFKSQIIDRYTINMIRFLKLVKEKYPDNGVNVSEFFIHNIASFYINIIEELLMHDVRYNEMLQYLRELMEFAFQGWKPLMNWYAFLPWDVK
jgi:hypothetical protein